MVNVVLCIVIITCCMIKVKFVQIAAAAPRVCVRNILLFLFLLSSLKGMIIYNDEIMIKVKYGCIIYHYKYI